MTGFTKTNQNVTRTEIQIMPNINDTLMHALSRSIDYVAIDGQVCFHIRVSADPVKSCWRITGPVGSLESTNQNWLCARLLPMAVSIHPVVCVHSCRLLGTQHHCLRPSGRGTAFGFPTLPVLISDTRDSRSGCKKPSQKTSSEYYTAELAMKQ